LIATTDGVLSLNLYDESCDAWGEISKIDLNKKSKNSSSIKKNFPIENSTAKNFDNEKLQITAIAISKDDKTVAVATISDSNKECQLRKIFLFEIDEDDNMIQKALYDFGDSQGENSLYSYLNFDYQFEGKSLLMAFQGGSRYSLDCFAVQKGKMVLVHSEPNYHVSDYSAISELDGRLYSVDFEGNMTIMDCSLLK